MPHQSILPDSVATEVPGQEAPASAGPEKPVLTLVQTGPGSSGTAKTITAPARMTPAGQTGAAGPGFKLPAIVKRFALFVMYTAISLGLILAVWVFLHAVSEGIPEPVSTLGSLWALISNPFYNNGPNDMGIGFQIVASLWNVMQGFLLGSLFSIPIGILMGSSEVFKRIMNPIAQILRPVSPLAWFPIGLASLHSAGGATVFVIFITSLWPTLINTAFGVSSLPQDYKTLAKVFRFTRLRYVRVVVLPYSLPYILTGLRLSLGIAWMVIVAAEMLAGGQGIGFFVWDSWNALNLERVVSAIIVIGTIGLVMDRGMEFLVRKTSYGV